MERPWGPQFGAPEYPGSGVAYVGQQPRGLQDLSKQFEKMRASSVHDEVSLAVANTPLVQLKRVVHQEGEAPVAQVFAKFEGGNYCQSNRLRAAGAIVRDAEFQGFLKKGMEVIEPVDHITVGNGIALASVCASLGYPCVLVMPENVSLVKQRMMRQLGAKVIVTRNEGIVGAVSQVERMMQQEKGKYFVARFFTDDASIKVHEATTAPEIWDATGGKVDCLVTAVLTGATLTGIRRFFNARGKRLHTIAVEPADVAVLSAAMKGVTLEPASHNMAGMGCGHIPGLLEMKFLDRVEPVTEADARKTAERLATEEGVLTDILGGAVMTAAIRAAHDQRLAGATIVCILPVGDTSLLAEETLRGGEKLEAKAETTPAEAKPAEAKPVEAKVKALPQQKAVGSEIEQAEAHEQAAENVEGMGVMEQLLEAILPAASEGLEVAERVETVEIHIIQEVQEVVDMVPSHSHAAPGPVESADTVQPTHVSVKTEEEEGTHVILSPILKEPEFDAPPKNCQEEQESESSTPKSHDEPHLGALGREAEDLHIEAHQGWP
eukprot:GGOE01020297.1.p1 GENE.GGOE01020297.1~~GGOE01020297.1.p1  ORF type:complete len:579 (-),score=116.13 GGOE01020297.1:494-2143(-)